MSIDLYLIILYSPSMNYFTIHRKVNMNNTVKLGDVVLVGYGSGDYPKLRLARIIKLLSTYTINMYTSEMNRKFKIRFIKSGVTEYGSEKGVTRFEKDIIKNFGSQNCKFTLEKLVKQFKKEYRNQKRAKAS